MAINRASIAKQLLPGLNAVFGVEYGEVNDEHTPLFETENSDSNSDCSSDDVGGGGEKQVLITYAQQSGHVSQMTLI